MKTVNNENNSIKVSSEDQLKFEGYLIYKVFPTVFDASVRYFEHNTDLTVGSDVSANIYDTEEFVSRMTGYTKMNSMEAFFTYAANIGSEIWVHGHEINIGITKWSNDSRAFRKLMITLISQLTARSSKVESDEFNQILSQCGIERLDEDGYVHDEGKLNEAFEHFVSTQFNRVQEMLASMSAA